MSKDQLWAPGLFIPKKNAGLTKLQQVLVFQTKAAQTYFAQAPVLGIRIDQQVDFSLAKTLQGNFNLVTFQDLPVTISINGIRSLYTTCNKATAGISDLYKKMKAGTSKQLIKLTIDKTTYQGVIVAFTQASTENPGIMTYSLTIFGVRM